MDEFSMRARTRLSELFDLKSDVIMGEVRVEINGQNRVTIENHRGIALYTEEVVRIAHPAGMLEVRGAGLHIENLIIEELVIAGRIDRIIYL